MRNFLTFLLTFFPFFLSFFLSFFLTMSTIVASSAVLKNDISEAYERVWGNMLYDAFAEDVNATLNEFAALDSEERYSDMLAERIADKAFADKWSVELLSAVIQGVADRKLVTSLEAQTVSPTEEEIFEGWTMPNLKLRKNIWENFPVSLIPLNDNDGTDRYAVVWHQKNLEEWRQERSMSWDEHQDYEGYSYVRLIHALRSHSHKYCIEPARTESQLCVLAMVHQSEESAVATAPVTTAPVVAVVRPLDILRQFPVTWDRNGATHDIKVHFGKCPRKDIPTMTANLLAALRSISSCSVSAPINDTYICRVVIN